MIFSIIIPTYNSKLSIVKCLESIQSQTFTSYEVIIIDGNSSDNTIDICKKFASNFPAIQIISERDNGIYDAMNKGIKLSSGDFLVFLNSGDCFANESSLSKLVSASAGFDLVYGDLMIKDQEDEWIKKYPDHLNLRYFYFESIPHPACLISKRLFNKVGFYDTTLKIVSDWKFFLISVIKQKCSYRHIDEVISIFDYQGISSIGSNRKRIELERRRVLKEDFVFFYYLYTIYLKLIGKSFYQEI